MEFVAVAAVIVWAQQDPVPVLSAIIGTLAVAAGAWVGVRSYQSGKKVSTITVGLQALTASLARADVDRVNQESRCAKDIARLQEQIDDLSHRLDTDTQLCDAKLGRLGKIVRDLGGTVPDDLVGLHAA